MALKARVTAIHEGTDAVLIVDVEFYDDAAPTVVLRKAAFDFPITMTVVQMRDAIIAKAQAFRSAAADKVTKAQQFIGAVIDIP